MSGKISLNSSTGKICLDSSGLIQICCPASYDCTVETDYSYDFDSSSDEHTNGCWLYENASILTSGTVTFQTTDDTVGKATRDIDIGSGFTDTLTLEVDLTQPETPAAGAGEFFWGFEFDHTDAYFYDIILQRASGSGGSAGTNYQTRILVDRPGTNAILNIPTSATSGSETDHTLKLVFDWTSGDLDVHWDGVLIGSISGVVLSTSPTIGDTLEWQVRGRWREYDSSLRSKISSFSLSDS